MSATKNDSKVFCQTSKQRERHYSMFRVALCRNTCLFEQSVRGIVENTHSWLPYIFLDRPQLHLGSKYILNDRKDGTCKANNRNHCERTFRCFDPSNCQRGDSPHHRSQIGIGNEIGIHVGDQKSDQRTQGKDNERCKATTAFLQEIKLQQDAAPDCHEEGNNACQEGASGSLWRVRHV